MYPLFLHLKAALFSGESLFFMHASLELFNLKKMHVLKQGSSTRGPQINL